jgi:hypothetical protein
MSLAGNDQQVGEEETPPLKASEAFGGQLISSSEAPPAKGSPSPASGGCSPTTDPASSTSSPDSPMSLFGPEDGFYSRTSRDSSPAVPARDAETAGSFYASIAEAGESLAAMPDESLASHLASWALLTTWPIAAANPALLESVQAAARVVVATRPAASSPPTQAPSSRWSAASSATSGFTTSPGECWIAATSECPSDGGVSSSLPDVLEADVPPRFYLSPKAAAGILRRARKRGRELPPALAEALRALASRHRDDGKRTTRTSSGHSSAARPEDGEATTMRSPAGSSSPSPTRSGLTPDQAAIAAAPSFISETQRAEVLETPYARQLSGSGGKPGQGYPAIRDGAAVRRLTPTECERLQGFPDGWTWVS